MKKIMLAMASALCCAAGALDLPEGARKSKFYEWDRHDFQIDGVKSVIVEPKKAAEGRPWIWRARFFGHQPQVDTTLLEKGFHVVYVDVANLYGSPEAVRRWNAAYAYVTEKLGFSKKPVLEGMSRGGLIVFNWAKSNPDKVAAIYADAPVCDFKDWPRAKSKLDWERCLKAYGMTDDEALKFADNPKDNLDALAAAGVPVLAVCGATDGVVRMDQNIDVLAANYRKLGGSIRVVSKPGNGHHPHSIQDPALITNFLLANSVGENEYIIPRGGIGNAIGAFNRGKATVAFLGGSIVEMNGFRPLTAAGLQKLYPSCDFTFIDAGISSTCSDTGAFRLQRDVLSKGKVDLLFVEFATNDGGDGTYPNSKKSLRAMEGIVRQAHAANPKTDVVLVYTANEGSTASYMSNAKLISAEMVTAKAEKFDNSRGPVKLPPQVEAFEKIAKHYDLPSINFGLDVAERMRHLEFDWKDFGGVHPKPMGNALYAEAILQFVKGARGKATDRVHEMKQAFCDANYGTARFADVAEAKIAKGWKVGVPDWKSVAGNKRGRYLNEKTIYADAPGAEFALKFKGSVIGLWLTAGIDAGVIEYSIDGGAWKKRDTFHQWSASLHYPYTLTLEDELPRGEHEIKVRVSAEKNPKSGGNAVRIMNFCVVE